MKVRYRTVLLCCAALGATSLANAATISLTPATTSVQVGQQLSFDLNMDFTDDATVGGGVDILFGGFTNNNELTFVSYTPANLGDPAFRRSPDVRSGELNGIAFGDFNGLQGPSLVGIIVFTANIAGNYLLNLAINDAPAGGFFSLTGQAQLPTLTGASFSVSGVAPTIPIPGAVWLMLSALAGLCGFVSRRTSVQPA